MDDPRRPKHRNDKELPRYKKSITDMLYAEPIRVNPNTETEDPSRAKLRNDKEEPRWRKSNTDNVLPSLETPAQDKALARRAKLRNERELPR